MNLITREELRAKLDRGDRFSLLMTLSAHAYRAKRIPTSLYFDTIGDAVAALDPDEEIVVYCALAPCAASIRAYHLLERAGYAHVRRYAGGIADWEDAGYPLDHGPPEPDTAEQPTKAPRARTEPDRPWHACAYPRT